MSDALWIVLVVLAVLVFTALVVGLVRYRRGRISLRRDADATPIDRSGGYTASSTITFSEGLPGVGDDAAIPRDAPKRPISEVQLPDVPVVAPPEEVLNRP